MLNWRWSLTFEDWARQVDKLVVEQNPSQVYALEGRTSESEHRHEKVPSECFTQPRWTSMSGFVVLNDQGDDRQVRAAYMPTSVEPLRPGHALPVAPPNVFYDRDHEGAEKAASEIAAFLQRKIVPIRTRTP